MANKSTSSRSSNRTRIPLLAVSAILWLSICASATPITLNSGHYPQPSNAGDGTIANWLIKAINTYNHAHGTHLSTASVGAHPDIKVDQWVWAPAGYPTFGSHTVSISLPANRNEYLVLRWGGHDGGVYQAFDLTTFPEALDTFRAPGRNNLAFYSFYGEAAPAAVPEPGTMALFGSGLVGLAGVLRRKFMS
jgi:PEP-CTERM motif